MASSPSSSLSSSRSAGRHELGQNNLVDPRVIDAVVAEVVATDGPIVEWAAGDGALTVPLARLCRPLQAVELDPSAARRLSRRVGPHVCIEEGDILRHAPPPNATVVGNIPFHITTPVLRHLFAQSGWQTAVLILQWEVARKRAGVGGATQFTAQWWPWLADILAVSGQVERAAAQAFCARHRLVGPRALPRALTADQWAEAYELSRADATRRGRR